MNVSLGVDVGGTFTDIVLVADGEVTTAKVPTTDDQSEGVLHGIDIACGRAEVDPDSVEEFRHAMTVATNAMLEGEGAKTALVTTEGFADVLEIGRQDRPALYDLSARKPEPLVPAERRYEVDERATPDGIERPVDTPPQRLVGEIDDDSESVAISLLHAYAHPENERRLAEALRDRLDAMVVASHETLSEFREYERTSTTVVDAAVTPVIDGYLDRLIERTTEQNIVQPRVMQSNGGIADAGTVRDHAVGTVLSGPAAGVVGASLFEESTHDGLITFDMGGTSSDVGLVRDGEIARTTSATVGGYPVHVPMVDVETVGAGGGSIAWVDSGGALRVGPQSAGATPGPACYGTGGDDPTVTDAALVLGYLGEESVLGSNTSGDGEAASGAGTTVEGGLSLDSGAAERALAELAEVAGLDGAIETARGIHRVANATMTRAIRRVTLERGHDPRTFALVAFGGAGPMHAGALASRLDIDTIRVPRANGVLSALGLLAADERHDASRTVRALLDTVVPADIESHYESLAAQTLAETDASDGMAVTRLADLRYAGQSYELPVEVPETFDASVVADRFHDAHERIRGYRLAEERIELVTLRVTLTVPGETPEITHHGTAATPTGHREASFGGEFRETPVYDRERVPVGAEIGGPAIFEGGESTVVVPPDWDVEVDDRGTLVLEVDR